MKESLQKLLSLLTTIESVSTLVSEALTTLPGAPDDITTPPPTPPRSTSRTFERSVHSFVRTTTLLIHQADTNNCDGTTSELIPPDFDPDHIPENFFGTILEKLTELIEKDTVAGLITLQGRISKVGTAFQNCTIAQRKAVEAADALQEENLFLNDEHRRYIAENKALLKKIKNMEDRIAESQYGRGQDPNRQLEFQKKVDMLEKELATFRDAERQTYQKALDRQLPNEDSISPASVMQVRELQDRISNLKFIIRALAKAQRAYKKNQKIRGHHITKGLRVSSLSQIKECRARFKRQKGSKESQNKTGLEREMDARSLSWKNEEQLNGTLEQNISQTVRKRDAEKRIIALETENEHQRLLVRRMEKDVDELRQSQKKMTEMATDLNAKTEMIAKLRSANVQQERLLRTQQGLVNELRAKLSAMEDTEKALREAIRMQHTEEARARTLEKKLEKLNEELKKKESELKEVPLRPTLKTVALFSDTDLAAYPPGEQPKEAFKRELERMATSHQRACNVQERQQRKALEDLRDDYSRRFAAQQAQMDTVVTALRAELDAYRSKEQAYSSDDEDFQGHHSALIPRKKQRDPRHPVPSLKKPFGVAATHLNTPSAYNAKHIAFSSTENILGLSGSSLTPTDTPGEFILSLPGASASIRVPIRAFPREEILMMHVTFPPQKLFLSSITKTIHSLSRSPGPMLATSAPNMTPYPETSAEDTYCTAAVDLERFRT